MSWLLYFLEAPVACVIWESHRIFPSSHPTFLLYLGLGATWSLAFGYIFSFVRKRVTGKIAHQQTH
jgi:hypothetical protein